MVRMGYDPNVVRRAAAIVATPTGDITTLIDAMMEPAVKSMLPSLTGSHVSIGPFGAVASSLTRKTRVRACVCVCVRACVRACVCACVRACVRAPFGAVAAILARKTCVRALRCVRC